MSSRNLGVHLDQLMFKAGKLALTASTANPLAASGVAGMLTGTFNSKNLDVTATVQALENDGLLRTLAEPTLTAISGESAKFLAGGEFAYQTCTGDVSNRSCSDAFKPYGVALGFSPVVLSEGRISLRINTEVSELSQEGSVNGTPGLKVRRAETTVELPSGGSMVLAGLIQESSKQTISGTPGLKDLPVLGALFRSREFLANQTELVVIVTPFVVSPVNDKQLATPLDRLNVATDRQTILFGRLNKVYGVSGDAPKGVIYHGNVGFIVE